MLGRSSRLIVIGGVVAALGVGVGTAYSASQSPSRSFLDDFASHLGLSPSKVQSAWIATMSDRLQQAVKDHRLTQAQADKILAQLKQHRPFEGPGGFGALPPGQMWKGGDHGPPPWNGPITRGRFGPGPFMHPGGGEFSAAAKYLGMSIGDALTQLRSGKTLAAIATARGKSASGLEAAMLKADQADLQSAVKDGRLTTKQESMIAAKLKQHIADSVEHGFRSFGHDDDGDSFHSSQSSGPTPSSNPWALS